MQMQILLKLPLDANHGLDSLVGVSRSFHAIVSDLRFAKNHIATVLARRAFATNAWKKTAVLKDLVRDLASVPPFTASATTLSNNQPPPTPFHLLPVSYKGALLHELFCEFAPVTKASQVQVFSLVKLSSEEEALKVISILLENDLRLRSLDLRKYAASMPRKISWAVVFSWACRFGYYLVVELLLQNQLVDPSLNNCRSFQLAAKYGHEKIVSQLITHPNVAPDAANNAAVRLASRYGHAKVLSCLLTHPAIDPSANSNSSIRKSSENGHVGVVRILLAHDSVDAAANGTQLSFSQFPLFYAHTVGLKIENYALYKSCENGHVEIVQLLLVRTHLANDNENDQQKRHNNPKYNVDPQARNNIPLRAAAANGHLEIVNLLLETAKVDPSANNNCALGLAAENGHVEIVTRLLQDSRVTPAAYNNYALRMACRNNLVAVVQVLLSDPRADPGAQNNEAFRTSCMEGHFVVVGLLLGDWRVDPSAAESFGLRVACERGHFEVVSALLKDGRSNVHALDRYCLRKAVENGHSKVADLILEHLERKGGDNKHEEECEKDLECSLSLLSLLHE
ncbi:UNVERIFIED_CONTAM: hypothetical protein HDU68_008360 [Siphonaria sp. JEL0065]|nr:hypothetical protein HDU68_008360 [Siphonaria sp. JEL0065]